MPVHFLHSCFHKPDKKARMKAHPEGHPKTTPADVEAMRSDILSYIDEVIDQLDSKQRTQKHMIEQLQKVRDYAESRIQPK